MIKRNNRKTAAPQTRWRAYVLIFTCALLMISGFFFAGRQHFSWMDYGMKNSRLRKQIDDLQAEKRRLLLAREVQLSPAEIKKAAKKAGLGDDAAVASVTLASAKEIKPAASAPAPVQASLTSQAKPMVLKTVAVSPAPSTAVAAVKKVEKAIKIAPKTAAAE